MFFGYNKPEWKSHTADHWYNFTLCQKWLKEEAVLDVVGVD